MKVTKRADFVMTKTPVQEMIGHLDKAGNRKGINMEVKSFILLGLLSSALLKFIEFSKL